MITQETEAQNKINLKLRRVVNMHFDPAQGSPFWIKKAEQLGIDARKEICCIEDLDLLGPMDEDALASRPIEDFIPQSLVHRRQDLILAETAGTLGKPKFAVHLAEEFRNAFVDPFVKAAKRIDFPERANWLFIGPTGPHIIGKAARACANALGSPDVFTVDFDPRWAKQLVQGGFASRRYLEHVQSQAMRVLEVQDIGVIFSTPVVLETLSNNLSQKQRLNIKGIHLGGMTASAEFMQILAVSFPKAVVLSGYGNTLFGMMPHLAYDKTHGFDYYPYGHRLIVRVVQYDQDNDVQCLRKCVEYGQRGQVMVHRLDDVQFIANMTERDVAVRIRPTEEGVNDGFVLDGIRDPRPIVNQKIKPVTGLY